MFKTKKDNFRTGYEDGLYPFVLYNRAVLSHKTMTKLLIFVFLFHLNNKLNVGSLVRSKSHVFKMTFMVRVKSYMEVSSETSNMDVDTPEAASSRLS